MTAVWLAVGIGLIFVCFALLHRRPLVAPHPGERLSDRWLLDHLYTDGKRGGSR